MNAPGMFSFFDSRTAGFREQLDDLLAWDESVDAQVLGSVEEILRTVSEQGDQALIEYTRRFDNLVVNSAAELEVDRSRRARALDEIDPVQRRALEEAAQRIREYHEHQVQESWQYDDALGNRLGQKVTPLGRVGVYVPGGRASYPSSVLMNIIPASVAGVDEVIMTVPAPSGELSPLVLAAAEIAGVNRVFTVGGAQAVAALAFGTATVPAVDKIVGPGNIYVATAKRLVFGRVGIDMVAGPSEVLIVTDGSVDPEWLVMDMFAQSEHDENAQAILMCPDAAYLERISDTIERLLPQMQRRDIIARSLRQRGALIHVANLDEAMNIANHIAPEHLELAVADPDALLLQVRNAGAVFMGALSCEAMGDYCAGPNHVLPTSRSARFFSPLGVYDFQKRSSVIRCSPEGAVRLAGVAATLGRGESLEAHARSAELRIPGDARNR